MDTSRCTKRDRLPTNPEDDESGEAEYFWEVDIFADGKVVMGNETMENDLENLVAQSWAEQAETTAEERQEAADLARDKWIEKGKTGY